jgi:hypothetical protein
VEVDVEDAVVDELVDNDALALVGSLAPHVYVVLYRRMVSTDDAHVVQISYRQVFAQALSPVAQAFAH